MSKHNVMLSSPIASTTNVSLDNEELIKIRTQLLYGNRSANPICTNCNRKVTDREEKRIGRLRQVYK